MAAEFPTSSKEFTTKQDGVDKIYASHVNDIQDEVMALEQALLGEILDGNVQYVKKPATSTDNAVPRFDGTDGKKIQNSGVIINDSGQLSGNGLDGWIYDTDTWTYVSATSFKISGKDVQYKFPKGTKIKLVQTSTKYFYVIATAYTSGNTTITITGGSDYALANATISGQAYSYAAAPQDFPQRFNYSPATYTGWSALPDGLYYFIIIGHLCYVTVYMTAGTSNATTAILELPVSASSAAGKGGICGFAFDDGTMRTAPTKWWIAGATNIVNFYTDMSNVSAWTASGTKRIGALITYEI